jgi:hypothetical protein
MNVALGICFAAALLRAPGSVWEVHQCAAGCPKFYTEHMGCHVPRAASRRRMLPSFECNRQDGLDR